MQKPCMQMESLSLCMAAQDTIWGARIAVLGTGCQVSTPASCMLASILRTARLGVSVRCSSGRFVRGEVGCLRASCWRLIQPAGAHGRQVDTQVADAHELPDQAGLRMDACTCRQTPGLGRTLHPGLAVSRCSRQHSAALAAQPCSSSGRGTHPPSMAERSNVLPSAASTGSSIGS